MEKMEIPYLGRGAEYQEFQIAEMAVAFKLSDTTEITSYWHTPSKQFNGTVVADALSYA
jgi:hypothetical protein